MLLMVVSVAFAQQTRNPNYKPKNDSKPAVQATENITVTSVNESFEGTWPPAGWAQYSPDGGTGWEAITVGTTPIPGWNGGNVIMTPTGNSGNSQAFCTWTTGGAASNDQWLVTPQVSVAANYTLSFWCRKFGAYLDNMDVKISTTTNQTSAFTTTVAPIVWTAADSGWVSYQYSLSTYAGQNIYVAFNEHVTDNVTDGAAVFVEMVRIDAGSGINNVTSTKEIRMYPNPVKGVLHIDATSEILNVRLANILGTTVENFSVNGQKTQINTSELQPGVYFITIETTQGTTSRKLNITR